jgi:hypothetical protein
MVVGGVDWFGPANLVLLVRRKCHMVPTRTYITLVITVVTSSFFGIGILPVSDLTGWAVHMAWYFGRNYKFGGNSFFPQKGARGAGCLKRGLVPPFSLEKGAGAPFLEGKRGSRQNNDTKMYRLRFPSVSIWEIPRNTDRYRSENTDSI